MTFSRKIKDEALVRCGRSCCVCHNFCGTKMELHHIVQKKDDGDNTLENCVPLCFDCHAEVKSYNPKHPKGTKFSDSELKMHRERWYEKVEKGGGIFVMNDEFRSLDFNMYEKITKEVLPIKPVIAFLEEQDFGQYFREKEWDVLRNFKDFCKRPDFEFMDSDLESARANLEQELSKLMELGSRYLFTVENHDDFLGIPKDWREEPKAKYWERVGEMNELATKVAEVYKQLIKLCKRKLLIKFE